MGRSRRWGSVYYHEKRKQWHARAGDKERTFVGWFDSESAANAAVEEARTFHRHQLKANGPGASLVMFGRAWLDREEIRGTRRGIKQDRSRFERHIASAPFAEWPIAAIEQRDIQRWIREVAAAPPRDRAGRASSGRDARP